MRNIIYAALPLVAILACLLLPSASFSNESDYRLVIYDFQLDDEWRESVPGVADVPCEDGRPCKRMTYSCRLDGPVDSPIESDYYFEGLTMGLYLWSDEGGTQIVRTSRNPNWPLIGRADLPYQCETPGRKAENQVAYIYSDYIEFWLNEEQEKSIKTARLGAFRVLYPPVKPGGGSYELPELIVSDTQPFRLPTSDTTPVPALPLPFILIGGVLMLLMRLRSLPRGREHLSPLW